MFWHLNQETLNSEVTYWARTYVLRIKNYGILLFASKEIYIAATAGRVRCVLMSGEQSAGENCNTKTGDKSFVIVATFRHVGSAPTHQNSIHEQIDSRRNWWNACYLSVQSLFVFRFVSKNVKIEIYRTIMLPVVLYGCETWSLTLREEYRLRVFENRVLRKIFGLRGTG